jgi:hypothetical protein
MKREFSIRLSPELAGWVRRQGSPQDVLETLAVLTARGKLRADAPDPGPGPERLTVRFPVSGLPKLRRLTRSRQNLVAFRKLIAAGYESQALPASRSVPALQGKPVRAFPEPVRAFPEPMRTLPESLALFSGPVREAVIPRGFEPLFSQLVGFPQANLAQRRKVEQARQWREILKFWFWPLVR